jgi:hypothetical protein
LAFLSDGTLLCELFLFLWRHRACLACAFHRRRLARRRPTSHAGSSFWKSGKLSFLNGASGFSPISSLSFSVISTSAVVE